MNSLVITDPTKEIRERIKPREVGHEVALERFDFPVMMILDEKNVFVFCLVFEVSVER